MKEIRLKYKWFSFFGMDKKIFIDDFLDVCKESRNMSRNIKVFIEFHEIFGWRYELCIREKKVDISITSPEGNLWSNETLKAGFNNGHGLEHRRAFMLYSALYWDLGGREFVNLPTGFYALDNKPNTPSPS